MADLVLWKPSFFGAKPEMVIKGGTIAWANMGDPNASIPTPEPVILSYSYKYIYLDLLNRVFDIIKIKLRGICFGVLFPHFKFKANFLSQVLMRPMFGAFGKAGSANSIAFVSKASLSPPSLFVFYHDTYVKICLCLLLQAGSSPC